MSGKKKNPAKIRGVDLSPKEGWHWRHCIFCGAKSHVTHLGGEKKLKWCSYCIKEREPAYCINCFLVAPREKVRKVL